MRLEKNTTPISSKSSIQSVNCRWVQPFSTQRMGGYHMANDQNPVVLVNFSNLCPLNSPDSRNVEIKPFFYGFDLHLARLFMVFYMFLPTISVGFAPQKTLK